MKKQQPVDETPTTEPAPQEGGLAAVAARLRECADQCDAQRGAAPAALGGRVGAILQLVQQLLAALVPLLPKS